MPKIFRALTKNICPNVAIMNHFGRTLPQGFDEREQSQVWADDRYYNVAFLRTFLL